jgi:hypothetical protein
MLGSDRIQEGVQIVLFKNFKNIFSLYKPFLENSGMQWKSSLGWKLFQEEKNH